MATFPSIEASFGFTKKSQPNTRIVKYADGYEHRILFGLASHQNPETYDLTWQNITETESDVIEAFLRTEANNSTSFTYSPPSEGFTKTGTYSQSSTDITITITDHRLFAGDSIVVDFTSGSASDGTYIVSSLVSANAFIITAASGSASGNVTITKTATSKFICDSWTKTINGANLADIDAVFVEKFEP